MPKMKTHSGAKKRFSLTGTGKVKFKRAKMRHILTKKNRKDFLATVGPFLLVVTFIEDGLRIFLRWGEQIHYMTSVMNLCARPTPGARLIPHRGAHGEAGGALHATSVCV